MPVCFANNTFHEVQFPNREILVSLPVKQTAPYVFAENAPIVRSGLILRKIHLPFVQQKMLIDTGAEIAVPVRANADNSGLYSPVSPTLAALIEKIDPVLRQFVVFERECYKRQLFHLFVE